MSSAEDRKQKNTITLRLFCPLPPAFKNQKRSIMDRNTGKQRTLTPGKIKKRMDVLESAILSRLYSTAQTIEGETHSECLRRLRTVLSGLSDDSLQEIPNGSWRTEDVAKGAEGITIIIEELE